MSVHAPVTCLGEVVENQPWEAVEAGSDLGDTRSFRLAFALPVRQVRPPAKHTEDHGTDRGDHSVPLLAAADRCRFRMSRRGTRSRDEEV